MLAKLTHIGLLNVWVYGGYCERVDRVYKPTNITGEPHLVLNIYWISNDVMMLPLVMDVALCHGNHKPFEDLPTKHNKQWRFYVAFLNYRILDGWMVLMLMLVLLNGGMS